MAAPTSRNPSQRVRFGHALLIEFVAEPESCEDLKEVSREGVRAVRLCYRSERSRDLKTATSVAASDENVSGSNEDDDVESLIDAFGRFDSARTKARSLHPRLETSVELDFMKSSMWTRRMARSADSHQTQA
eukprot:TRINITY_DN56756_c0_g1_i1.p1 TRINITY_DN56756_c0_g1~~TRINITY_DN56756_c0_g1_i1.p1  ORF type:complete len:132 (+),score=25.33 TRINITY_DN56756_c0_g1_i1:151-546(+)